MGLVTENETRGGSFGLSLEDFTEELISICITHLDYSSNKLEAGLL